MANNVSEDSRFKELHARMTAVGGGPRAFSASEMHELSEYVDELIKNQAIEHESVVGDALNARVVLLSMAEECEAIPDGARTRLDRLRANVLRAAADVLVRHDAMYDLIAKKRGAFGTQGIAEGILADVEAILFGGVGVQYTNDLNALLLQGIDACIDIVKRRRAYYESYKDPGAMQTRPATFAVIDELLTLLEAHRERTSQRATTAT